MKTNIFHLAKVRFKRYTPSDLVVDVIVFLLASYFFTFIVLNVDTDIQSHNAVILSVQRGKTTLPAYFLYFLTMFAVGLFNGELWFLSMSSAMVLGLSTAAKLVVTRAFFIQTYQNILNDRNASNKTARLFSLLLLITFSVPTSTLYVGQLPPNVWHNSTMTFLMPFALATFWLSYKQLIEPKSSRVVNISVLCILGILAKPSFFLVFAIAYPLMLIRCFGFSRRLWQNLIPVLIGLATLAILYHATYVSNSSGQGVYIAVRPFYLWSLCSSNIPYSLVGAQLFPIIYFLLYPKDIVKHILLQYAVAAYFIALSIFILLVEVGRELDGNFAWQALIYSYILFLCVAILFAEKLERFGILNWKNAAILLAFLMHVVSGILYILYIIYFRRYS